MRLPSTVTEPAVSALRGLVSAASGLPSSDGLSLSAAKAPGAISSAASAATRGSLRMERPHGAHGSGQHRRARHPVHTPEVTLAPRQQRDRQYGQAQSREVGARQPLAE